MAEVRAIRGSILHCLADPGEGSAGNAVEYFDDGVLVIGDGLVQRLGDAAPILAELSADVERVDHSGKLIVPGFIDCHVHYAQVDIIASWGEQLLDWLDRYAYPAERRFADRDHAEEAAAFFVDELLRNGTTTALVFATVHAHSVDAIFGVAKKRNMRLLAGKVLMDRNCPADLCDDADTAYVESRALIDRWHGDGRLAYAITPRFALTSSEEQLSAAGRLAGEFPEAYVHTHLAENEAEVAMIAEQFPWSRSYLDVYEHFGLLRERSVFAHCLHIDEQDRTLLATKGGAIAFCPSSNLFLGSGLFDLRAANDCGIRVGIGTDVGGGTSLNMLRTLNDGYKSLQLKSQALPGYRALYLATLGAARALYLDDRIGNFAAGKEADFVVLDSSRASMTARRVVNADDVAEKLFALIMLGDDRAVAATYLMGEAAYTAR